MSTRSYGEFSAGLRTALGKERHPLTATIEVTRRCPLECSHCYNNLPMDDPAARREELSLEELRRLVDEIVEAGCLWLLFTGGEIFARSDFLDLYTYARQRGLIITLFTNGTLITPRIADHLVRWRPFSVEITLYGATRESYEALTGIPGSFDRCHRGIRLLHERGLPLKLKTVAVKSNRHEVARMQEFAEELGVEFKFDALINPRIDCSRSPLETRLEPPEVVALDLEDPERVESWRSLSASCQVDPASRDKMYHCGGGLRSFAVDPYGKMSICVLSRADEYDLRSGSFRDGWEGFLKKTREKKATRVTKCTACGLKAICGMCPANGELDSGDPEEPVDFLCHVAHLRALAMGIPAPPHGDCEYCEGGSRRGELLESLAAVKAAVKEPRPATPEPTLRLLPVLSGGATKKNGCGGGCASCGAAAEETTALKGLAS